MEILSASLCSDFLNLHALTKKIPASGLDIFWKTKTGSTLTNVSLPQ